MLLSMMPLNLGNIFSPGVCSSRLPSMLISMIVGRLLCFCICFSMMCSILAVALVSRCPSIVSACFTLSY